MESVPVRFSYKSVLAARSAESAARSAAESAARSAAFELLEKLLTV